MRLKSIRLNNFRNHRSSFLNFSENINILYGNNGQGKTNILEGISYLCLTKGFISSIDSNSILFNEPEFELEGEFYSEVNVTSKCKLKYSTDGSGKNLFHNDVKVEKLISYIGEYPVVLLAPQHYGIVGGLPAERRKFIDLVVSQSSKSYFTDIMEYRKVLKQRNKILLDSKISRTFNINQIEPWNESLVKYGSRVIQKRHHFINEFLPYFLKSYEELTTIGEQPSINYIPGLEQSEGKIDFDNIQDFYFTNLNLHLSEELKKGTTLIGPHRDECIFTINDLDVRQFASQGQQKTFLVALKIAEFFYLKEKCFENPILVLDDVFSELDEERSKYLLTFLQTVGQVFISSTSSDIFDKNLEYGNLNSKFYIKDGCILQQSDFN